MSTAGHQKERVHMEIQGVEKTRAGKRRDRWGQVGQTLAENSSSAKTRNHVPTDSMSVQSSPSPGVKRPRSVWLVCTADIPAILPNKPSMLFPAQVTVLCRRTASGFPCFCISWPTYGHSEATRTRPEQWSHAIGIILCGKCSLLEIYYTSNLVDPSVCEVLSIDLKDPSPLQTASYSAEPRESCFSETKCMP